VAEHEEQIDDPFDEDDWDDENTDLLAIKWLFEGVASLPDLASAFRALAADIDERVRAGWRLQHPVDGGHVFLRRDGDLMDTW